MLNKNNEQIERQRNELRRPLDGTQTAQAPIDTNEKRLTCELTAGIAHEIQNPLNFVNNFSEVSLELADELKKEATEGNRQEVIAIAGDIAVIFKK
jgi:signal transduction histidine kinase